MGTGERVSHPYTPHGLGYAGRLRAWPAVAGGWGLDHTGEDGLGD